MLYVALTLMVVAALLKMAAVFGGTGISQHVAHTASIGALGLAIIALLLFALTASYRKRGARPRGGA
jgi:uncharacterized membrane protein YvlD (DUF360 family)